MHNINANAMSKSFIELLRKIASAPPVLRPLNSI